MLAAHERGFLDPGGDASSYCSTADGTPIRVAKHARGWPQRTLRDDVDLRDFYFQSYVFRSVYHDQLHRWLRLFPRQQLMIVPSECFFDDSVGTMNAAAEFLGLEPFEFDNAERLQRTWDAGAGGSEQLPQDYAAMDDGTRTLLADFFAPYNEQLYRLIGEEYGWS